MERSGWNEVTMERSDRNLATYCSYLIIYFHCEFSFILSTVELLHLSYSLEEVVPGFYTCQLFLKYRREIFILGFLKMTWSFPNILKEVRSLPKMSVCDVSGNSPRISSLSLKTCINVSLLPVLFTSKIARKLLWFIHFTHGFRSLHGSEWTYFWKLCQARRQQLTFLNQAWEIGPQAWAGVRSKFSTRRRETHA